MGVAGVWTVAHTHWGVSVRVRLSMTLRLTVYTAAPLPESTAAMSSWPSSMKAS